MHGGWPKLPTLLCVSPWVSPGKRSSDLSPSTRRLHRGKDSVRRVGARRIGFGALEVVQPSYHSQFQASVP